METGQHIPKARLLELDENGTPKGGEHSSVAVQFNPETLKVTFANQIVPPNNSGGGDQSSRASTQFVGTGTTKLAVQLWFDVTSVIPDELASSDEERRDVRKLTQKVAYFITPQTSRDDPTKKIPPLVRFLWGSFQFDGIMDSLEESLEFFSPEGVPLRAGVTISLSQQSIQFAFGQAATAGGASGGAGPGGAAPAGTAPLTPAPSGASLQSMAAAQGKGDQWQQIAAANNIENPRVLNPGQLVNMNPPAGGSSLFGG